MSAEENVVQNVPQQDNQVAEGEGENVQNDQAQAAPRAGGWAMFKTLLIRMVFIYMISSFFRRSPAPETGPDGKLAATTSAINVFTKGQSFDLYVYLTESEKFQDFNSDDLFWMEEDLAYGDWTAGLNGDGSFEKSSKIQISEAVMNNGTIFLHTFIVKAGKSPDPSADNYDNVFRLHQFKRLNKYKKKRYHTTVNLLTGSTDAHPDMIKKENDSGSFEIISCWHPNITINFVEDYTPWQKTGVPAPLDEYIHFSEDERRYWPILYYNDYWNLHTDYMPINETTPELTLNIVYSPISLFRWQMYAAQGMRNKWYSSVLGDDFMEESDEDQDSLKTTLVETNPYLLGITIVVSIIHSVFEFMAFKNDIQFWKNRKSLEGLSVRSVMFNVFQSLIVVLYVLDNETNFVVRVSVIVGLAIECWKITKVFDIKLDRENLILGLIPRVSFSEKSTYVASKTKEFDQLAFKYLSWALFPLLGAYAVYSVVYNEHKGWYSFTLSMLYGFLLTFGFIMMTPQLFINYKLKSVAHLPWRMMTYKALNTFIDDLFAFVIKMPMLYRLGCFRDDIVFIIFLYQKWIYPVDKSRVNEFGVSGDDLVQQPNGDAQPVEGADTTEPAAIEGADPTAIEGAEPSAIDGAEEPSAIDGAEEPSDIEVLETVSANSEVLVADAELSSSQEEVSDYVEVERPTTPKTVQEKKDD